MKITFVTGKGGVGKSAVAAALAQKYAMQGKKTLLVELGATSFYSDFFAVEGISYHPKQLRENFYCALWSGSECLKEYAQHLLKIESLYRLFFENPVTRSFIGVAPALTELALLGKITSQQRKVGPSMDFEHLVIDAYATGHFTALLQAPRGMSEAIQFGPMGEQSRGIEKILKEEKFCDYKVVAIAEELPTAEAQEICEKIKKTIGITPEVIFNKLIGPSPQALTEDPGELKKFQEYISEISNREEKFTLELSANYRLKKAKMIFSTSAWQIVEGLAESL